MERRIIAPETISRWVRSLPDATRPFVGWVEQVHREGRLATFLDAVVKTGNARDEEEALAYLNRVIGNARFDFSRLRITQDDLGRQDARQRLFLQVEQLLGRQQSVSSAKSHWRFHGIVSHEMLRELLTGGLSERRAETEQQGLMFETRPFGGGEWQQPLFEYNGQAFPVQPKKEVLSRQKARQLMVRIEELWGLVLPVMEASNVLAAWQENQSVVKEFFKASQSFFGKYAEQLLALGNEPDDWYLNLVTFMSWAMAIAWHQQNDDRILFCELPILAPEHDFSGGRMDALEVTAINGSAPTKNQQKKLRRLAQYRYQSVGQLIDELMAAFGPALTLVVWDWKMAVGDDEPDFNAVSAQWQSPIITYPKIAAGPLFKHQNQMIRYLTLGSFDHDEWRHRHGQPRRWPEEAICTEGRLVYFLPGRLPVIHLVVADSAEQNRFFQEQIVFRWDEATQRSVVRHCDRLVGNHLIRLLKDGGLGDSRLKEMALALIGGKNLFALGGDYRQVTGIEEVVASRRVFVDEDHIFERAGMDKGGQNRYLLHLNQLLAAIKRGYPARGFHNLKSWGPVGSILCPFHDDHRPTNLHLYLRSGFFKCFACGVYGRIAPSSIPHDLDIVMIGSQRQSRRSVKKAAGKTVLGGVWGMETDLPQEALEQQLFDPGIEAIEVSVEHAAIMATTQELLQASFLDSQGELYLKEERWLDSKLAHRCGVGFGKARSLINGLLDRGYRLEQLIRYGLVGAWKPKKNGQKTSFMWLLQERLSLADIRAALNTMDIGDDYYPYCALEDRVTMPLELNPGTITNFYGRSIYKWSKLPHVKLSQAYTAVPHGAFNMKALANSSVSEVLVVEAMIDALTLMQMGYPGTISVIGINNWLIIDRIIRASKERGLTIGVALDNDESGRLATHGGTDVRGNKRHPLLKLIERRGVRAHDFTSDFIAHHADKPTAMLEQHDDWNTYWIQVGRFHQWPHA